MIIEEYPSFLEVTLGYSKFLVDNTTCSRRFHVTFDDEAPPVDQAQLQCPHCGVVVFTAENHPPLTFQREENLVKTVTLSDNIATKCDFSDKFSTGTIPALKGQPPKPMYHK